MPVYAGHFDFTQPLYRTIPSVFSPEECARVLASVREGIWFDATVNSQEGRVIDKKIRDSSTAVLREEALAQQLFERIRPLVPARMSMEEPATGRRIEVLLTGIFWPLRVYRYTEGQHFGVHHDQSYTREDGARSLLTLMVYLNDDFEGGTTDFPEQKLSVLPKTGTALWFQHMLLHAGRAVKNGTKYVLRSDVLYAPADGSVTT